MEVFGRGNRFVEVPGSLEARLRNRVTASLPPTMKFPLDPSVEEGREGTESVRHDSVAQAKRSGRKGHDASEVERVVVGTGGRLAAWPLRSRRRPENRGAGVGDVLGGEFMWHSRPRL